MLELRGVWRAGGVAACVIATLVLLGLSAPSVRAQGELVIAGEVDGLYPGADVRLDARVTNPHPFPIRVVSMSAVVFAASTSCPASMLEIGDAQATVEVPAGATGTVPLEVRMSIAAPDACQGATWPLEFAGTAVGTGTIGLPDTDMVSPRSLAALAAIGAALVVGGLVVMGRDRRRHGRRPA